MAIPILPILRTLPTIIVAVREVTSSLNERRGSGAAVKVEERTKKLEDDLVKAGSALAELAMQVQALVEELRAQAEQVAAQRRKTTWLLGATILALATSVGTLAYALFAR